MRSAVKVDILVSTEAWAWLKFLGKDEVQIRLALQDACDTVVRDLVWNLKTGEEGTCIDCGNTLGWAPHRDDCRFHQKNLPEELK